jgi:hypothetical protein
MRQKRGKKQDHEDVKDELRYARGSRRDAAKTQYRGD